MKKLLFTLIACLCFTNTNALAQINPLLAIGEKQFFTLFKNLHDDFLDCTKTWNGVKERALRKVKLEVLPEVRAASVAELQDWVNDQMRIAISNCGKTLEKLSKRYREMAKSDFIDEMNFREPVFVKYFLQMFQFPVIPA